MRPEQNDDRPVADDNQMHFHNDVSIPDYGFAEVCC